MNSSTQTATRHKAPIILVAVVLAGTLLFPYVGGSPLAYVLIVATLGLLGWLAVTRQPWYLRGERGARAAWPPALPSSRSALASRRGRPTILMFIVNFAMLAAVCADLRDAATQRRHVDGALIVARLALAGTALLCVVVVLVGIGYMARAPQRPWTDRRIVLANTAMISRLHRADRRAADQGLASRTLPARSADGDGSDPSSTRRAGRCRSRRWC